MFPVRTGPALTRLGADSPFNRLLSIRRLRSTGSTGSTVRSASAEPQDGVSTARSPRRGGRDTGTGTGTDGIYVDFEQTRGAYKSKDSLELLRSLLVLKLCSFDLLVDKNKEVMRTRKCPGLM